MTEMRSGPSSPPILKAQLLDRPAWGSKVVQSLQGVLSGNGQAGISVWGAIVWGAGWRHQAGDRVSVRGLLRLSA